MDSPEFIIDPNSEVRKLQELVKKLEYQNEILRSKQSEGEDNDDRRQQQRNGDIDRVNKNNVNDYGLSTEYGHVKLLDNFVLDDLEDVNFSDLPDDDDSWLYTSPKAATTPQPKEPLLSWVRQDFDHPCPEVESARRSLISRLNEVARLKHSSSSPVIGGQPAFASKSAMSLNRSAEGNNNIPSRGSLLPKTGIPTSGLVKPQLNTSTFTRPKRTLTPMHGEGDQPQDVPYLQTATDISDIENLAKQQEENLRQSLTPASLKAMRAKHSLMEGDNRTCHSPSRFDLDGSYVSHHRGSLGSDHSTPPDSPHNASPHNASPHFQLGSSIDSRGRRILPGSPGLHYQSHNSSDSSLERHSVASDEMNVAPEAARAPASQLQQPNYRSAPRRSLPLGIAPGLAQQQRSSGLPTPRKKIMKPATPRSSLPMLQRSNIPSPKPPSSGGSEETWRDGCF
ncbi:hypothetical protein BsWGS_27315 [Bradybaena similaris]